MDNTIKSINFADDTEDHQRTERISPELVNGYAPEYVILMFESGCSRIALASHPYILEFDKT